MRKRTREIRNRSTPPLYKVHISTMAPKATSTLKNPTLCDADGQYDANENTPGRTNVDGEEAQALGENIVRPVLNAMIMSLLATLYARLTGSGVYSSIGGWRLVPSVLWR